MAKLQSGNLTLEIIVGLFEYDWVTYEIKFYWKDDVIVNDNILKRAGEFWRRRSHATFMANDYGRDHLIETIKNILETRKSEYWEPIEPDIIMAIYPNEFFPFMESHWTLIEDDEDGNEEENIKNREKEEREKETDIRKEQNKNERYIAKNPDDLFTIISFIDAYSFEGQDTYSGEGISLHMIVTRNKLEMFAADLEIEYTKRQMERKEICQ